MLLVNKADPWNKTNLDYNDAIIDNVEGQNILSSSRKVIFKKNKLDENPIADDTTKPKRVYLEKGVVANVYWS